MSQIDFFKKQDITLKLSRIISDLQEEADRVEYSDSIEWDYNAYTNLTESLREIKDSLVCLQ